MNAARRLQLLGWAAAYFVLVFGAGFALGPLRVLWLEPRVGLRTAELIEAPFMLLAITLAARWIGHRLRPDHGALARLGVGALVAFTAIAPAILGHGRGAGRSRRA